MRQFNLEEAKAGKKVVTRDGKAVRILCFDKAAEALPLIVLVMQKSGRESTESHTIDGHYSPGLEHPWDLVMAPETVEGWLNVYPYGATSNLYGSEEDADSSATPDRIACVRIEYEI